MWDDPSLGSTTFDTGLGRDEMIQKPKNGRRNLILKKKKSFQMLKSKNTKIGFEGVKLGICGQCVGETIQVREGLRVELISGRPGLSFYRIIAIYTQGSNLLAWQTPFS